VYHGVSLLMHPAELESLPTAVAVLGAAGALESYTLSVAWSEMKSEATKLGMSPWQYIIAGPDPLNPAVLLEDSVAVVGVGVAAGAIGLTHVTGNPAYDAIGSIAVGTMMGAVAIFIINRNRTFLGGTVPRRTQDVVTMLLQDEMVLSVQDVKSVMVGPAAARFKAEIHFNPALLSDKYLSAHNNLEEACKSCQAVNTQDDAKLIFERYSSFLLATLSIEVDRLEHLISSAYPEFKYIGACMLLGTEQALSSPTNPLLPCLSTHAPHASVLPQIWRSCSAGA
jgi:zinc transporter 9